MRNPAADRLAVRSRIDAQRARSTTSRSRDVAQVDVWSTIASQPVPPIQLVGVPTGEAPGGITQFHVHEADTAFVQHLGRLAHDGLGERVARETAVAEQEGRVRRDHVRRVRDDHVELLAGDRLEQAAVPDVDRLQPVQRRIEARELERARVEVRGDDLLRVARQQQRLDTRAGAQVERPSGRRPGRHGGEFSRGLSRPRDAVLRAASPVRDRRRRGRGPSARSRFRRQPVLEDAQRFEPLERERSECVRSLFGADGRAQIEQPDQGPERTVGASRRGASAVAPAGDRRRCSPPGRALPGRAAGHLCRRRGAKWRR